MSIKASCGSPLAIPQLYRTTSISTIIQAEQQDRFLQLGELNQLVTFLRSGKKRLEIANILTQNANILVAQAADKIFTGGSAISYLEKPQASILFSGKQEILSSSPQISSNIPQNTIQVFNSLFSASEATPPGFKPIDVVKYGSTRMSKSLRDLDWFLRYLTYAIIAGDPNILLVNIRGLRELIENACSSAAAVVALREMRRAALRIFNNDPESETLIREYFNVIITAFESPAYTDKIRKRESSDLQGLKLPQIYAQAGSPTPRFVMKTSLSEDEKKLVIQACYRQVFERDISKAYSLSLSNLESQLKNGQLSVKEFIRNLGLSTIYRKQFFEPFVNSRVVELAFRHFLGRGLSSLKEFQTFFSVLSEQGLSGLVNALINSNEYSDYFGEETVPYIRDLGEDPQECRNWGPQIDLFKYSAPFKKIPQFITLFNDYNQALPDQHPYGKSNDPLAIQFGAIFPKEVKNSYSYSAPFGKDTRRILVRQGPGIYNQLSNPSVRAKPVGLLGPKIFQTQPNSSDEVYDIINNKSNLYLTPVNKAINVIYIRVFGRLIYEEERLLFKPLESQFTSFQISVREFIRQLAKSSVFRSLYWEPLYICKAIEYIHNRLLGRPTYGRQEINQYFNIAYKQGYYKVIDAILDSLEYIETFGENIIPYDRYITPSGLASRVLRLSNVRNSMLQSKVQFSDRYLELGKVQDIPSLARLSTKIRQGVSARRYQSVVFRSDTKSSILERQQAYRACLQQLFERSVNSFSIGNELFVIEQAFITKKLTVKQLVIRLGHTKLYQGQFYQPYPNTKVIELGTKHFLGRAPNNQAEIRYYNQILASQGLQKFVSSLVNSLEYDTIFGDYIVPYRRFPSLPAANFPNTEKLYNCLTKQNSTIVSQNLSVQADNN